jgi:hypothetical protein
MWDLFCDSDDRCIKGYTKKIVASDGLHVEMWELYLGLNMVWKEYFSHLIVESDSEILIDIFLTISIPTGLSLF